ncbi:MAG TPA: phosphatase PAP2 family protein [Solirubrobacterales bacterium]
MSTSELAPAATAERAADLGLPRWALVRRCALLAYLGVLVAWSLEYGVPVQRELVMLWVCGALAVASLGRSPRQIRLLLFDWLPIAAVLCAYDYTRGAADSVGIGTHFHPMIEFDRFLFFGQTPTEWLQRHLYDPGALTWWNVAFTLVYTSYFITPFALAGWLWVRDRPAFLRFAKRLVTLAVAGLATYVLFPAAPPWMAAEHGLLHGVQRTTANGWEVIGGGTAGLFDEGQASVNLVAAVPSLHSAFTLLVALFLWPRVRRRWRPLLLAYPLAMGLTLLATGEHYFFDVALGWIYAGATMLAWRRWERRRRVLARPAGAAHAGAPTARS